MLAQQATIAPQQAKFKKTIDAHTKISNLVFKTHKYISREAVFVNNEHKQTGTSK